MKNIVIPALTLRFFLTLSACLGICSATHAQSWNNVGLPDFSDANIQYPSMAIAGNGNIYVACQDYVNGKKASVMKFNGTNWVYVGPPGFSAGKVICTSIALDTGGTPYIAFADATDSDKVTVMKYFGGSWVTVGSRGFSIDSTQWENIAIDSRGAPYVAFENVRYSHPVTANVMKFDGTDWVNVGVPQFDIVALGAASFAIAANDTPYLGYACSVGDKAKVVKFDGTAWVTVGVAGFSAGECYTPSLAIDGSGEPYLAYQDAAYSDYATVMKYNGSTWVNVGSPGFSAGTVAFTTLKIDGSGAPYVGYYDYTLSGKATVMKYTGSSWVNAGSPGFTPGIAYDATLGMDACGTPYMLFLDVADTNKARVMMLSPAPVAGIGTLCMGDSAVFNDISCYGGWSSSNAAIAIVGTNTGLVTAVSAGTAIISYAVYGIPASVTVTVNPLPDAGTINGVSHVWCAGNTTLTDSVGGGTWVSSNSAIGTITSAGVVATRGWNELDTILYIVSNTCGSDTARFPILFYCEGIKNVNNNVFSIFVFPNPNPGNFTLTLSSLANEPAQITITNMLGEKVKEFTIATNKEINVQLNVPLGVYFVSGVTNSGSVSGKVVVE